SRSILRKGVVWIAVQPALPRLCRCDHGMLARLRVLGCVAVRRVITTTRRAALLTRSQMNPACADFHAFLTLSALRVFDGRNSLDMSAGCLSHRRLSPTGAAPYVRRRPR